MTRNGFPWSNRHPRPRRRPISTALASNRRSRNWSSWSDGWRRRGHLDESIEAYERGSPPQGPLRAQASTKPSRRSSGSPARRTAAPRSSRSRAKDDRYRRLRHSPPACPRPPNRIEETLDWLLPKPRDDEARLFEAMRYATLGGGKRLRPVPGAVELPAVRRGGNLAPCASHRRSSSSTAIPWRTTTCRSMDDDELRRGKPTTHRQFDEATAILAGDALLTLAFEVLAHPDTHTDPLVRSNLVVGPGPGGGGARHGRRPDDGHAGPRRTDFDNRARSPACNDSRPASSSPSRAKPGRSAVASTARGAMPCMPMPMTLGLAFQIADDLLERRGAGGGGRQEGAQGRRPRKGHLRLDPGPGACARSGADAGRPGNPPPRAIRRPGPIRCARRRGSSSNGGPEAGRRQGPSLEPPGTRGPTDHVPRHSPSRPGHRSGRSAGAGAGATAPVWRTSCAPRPSTRSPSPAGIWGPAWGVVELTVAAPLCVRHAGRPDHLGTSATSATR